MSKPGGMKFDNGKPRMELISRVFLEELAKVLSFGAQKYEPWQWKKGFESDRLVGATLRHIHAYNSGETTDPESGLPHLAHAACNLMFLLDLSSNGKLVDTRYKDESKVQEAQPGSDNAEVRESRRCGDGCVCYPDET